MKVHIELEFKIKNLLHFIFYFCQKFYWIALMLVALATISSANIDDHDELIEDQIINYRTDSRVRRQVASKMKTPQLMTMPQLHLHWKLRQKSVMRYILLIT